MQDFFMILFLIDLVLIVISFINPATGLFWYKKQQTRRKACGIYGAVLMACVLGIGSTGQQVNATDKLVGAPQTKQASSIDTVDHEEEIKPLAVSPKKLVSIYDANEVSADETYKGNKVILTGIVDHVGKDMSDEAYMTFKSASFSSLTQVQCYFKDNQLIDDLRPGDKVAVTGVVAGKSMNVLVKDCELK